MTRSEDETDGTNEVEAYVCETCGKEFDSEAALEAHIRDAGLVD
ncbi:C2H2-type zinc finger protein [Haloprofundus marisrubri]|nr:C2H2-type zinc finger protein [Haloprofundus marisrubri]